jgi:tetraacyldisaccharide 4'-kinase
MSYLDFQITFSWKNPLKWLFLKGLSLLYSSLIQFWLFGYQAHIKKGWSARKRVISIGNITMGGTGKTPMVDWLLSFLKEQHLEAAVLTRGYKAQRTEKHQVLNQSTAGNGNRLRFGDEPWLLFHNHPNISIYISPDRVESAKRAQADADILLLDDGMQHRRLKRDLEIVMIDAVSGIGNGQIFPLGPLREPLRSLLRADIIIYSKSNLISSQQVRKQIADYLRQDVRQFDSEYLPDQLLCSKDLPVIPPAALNGKKCLLFSGIGNPTGFTRTVANTGAIVQGHIAFEDHQEYNLKTIEHLKQYADSQPYDYLICTEKDWVKLEQWENELPAVYRLKMKMQIDAEFITQMAAWISREQVG